MRDNLLRISETLIRYNIVKCIIITINNAYFADAILIQMKTGF
jgi:hypothetical protein